MSPLVTCPCMPVPLTFDGSTPLSAGILRTDGSIGISPDLCAAAAAGFGASAGFGAGAAAFGAPAPSLIWPSSAPTATVSPFFAAMSESTPAAGAGTSSVTLSVSSSTSGSSAATASPGCLNHLPTVASVTDSPRVGTRMSAMTSFLYRHGLVRHDAIPILSKRLVKELLELRQVLRHLTDGSRCRGRTSSIVHRAMLGADLVENPLQEHVDEEPCPHVARLFLAPDHLRLLEAGKYGDQGLGRKWIELLEAQEIDIVDTALLAFVVEIVIDLARAHDDAADLVVGDELDRFVWQQLRIIPQQAMERGAVRQLVQPRYRTLVAQQRFRRHQNERLADFAPQLPAQDVEVVRGRRAVRNLHIVFCAHLQEALEPRRGMLWSLPLVAMRQQTNEARHPQPFALPGGDELVEHDLRAVREVAELRFP